MRRGLSGLFLLVSLAFLGCATAPRRGEVAIPQDHFSEIQAAPVPLVMNDRVQDWINYFQGPSRERFERYLQRSGKHIPMIKRILRQYGLPDDLVYLAMIESGFNPHAYSRARATGTWQFIYRTGVRYGLRATPWIDERRDPEKSTVAAAKYLKDLYDQFNDWYLAAAGYNAGEGKIHRAIKKYRTEDFWEMSRQRYLRRETKDYVPKMIAAAMIAKDPERYGFRHVRYEEPVRFETVTIETPTDLRVAAQCAGATYEEIRGLNPELLTWVTPPDYSDYQMKVPDGRADDFRVRYSALTPAERIAQKVHEAKPGESVHQIANRYGIPVRFFAAINGLPQDKRLAAGQTVLIPNDPPDGERFREPSYERRRRRSSGSGTVGYRVRRGDHLGKVSRQLGVRSAELRKLNPEIDWANLKYGERLRLVTSGGAASRGAASRGATPARTRSVATVVAADGSFLTHTVQAGETLWEIARKYGVTVHQLKEWNGLSNHRRLRPGVSLKVRIPPAVASASPT